MSTKKNNGISPALSQLEICLDLCNKIQKTIKQYEFDIFNYSDTIERLKFELEELRKNESFCQDLIDRLKLEARDEGLSDEYIERFLKRCHYKPSI